jgi:uncharacterized protein (DUF885 family)
MTVPAVIITLLSLALGAFPPSAWAAQTTQAKTLTGFDALVDDYFDFYFETEPTQGTEAGFHQFDDRLENFSAAAVDARIAGLERFRGRFDRFEKLPLPEPKAGDLRVLQGSIDSQLLELKSIRMWRKDPDLYSTVATDAAFVIMRRNFAPVDERLRSLIARERKMPEIFQAARQNLENPPLIYTQVALQQLPDDIEFFRQAVPQAFSSVKDQKLLAEFKDANDGVVRAFTDYHNFVRDQLLANSHGDFRLGEENFRRKLLCEEMVDIPIARLLEIGHEDLRRNQLKLQEAAAKIDPEKPLPQVLADLRKDHPASDQLLENFRALLGGLRSYIESKGIITLPPGKEPVVEETPPFERALTTASMDTPGAYETRATDAFMNVTVADPSWSKQQIEEWMQGFNRGTIVSTAVHEVYPGHYVQFLWLDRAPSKTRKLLYSSSNAEGWAHYTEQMMLDEGYGDGDLKLRVGQLEDALLRDARFIVGIEMHTGKMTLDQAQEFFVNEGYQTRPVAEVEAKRGTSDPTYLVYTLGKLQIMKLREDYKKLRGGQFQLREFHDRFMEQGAVPVKLIRKAMLGNDSPPL